MGITRLYVTLLDSKLYVSLYVKFGLFPFFQVLIKSISVNIYMYILLKAINNRVTYVYVTGNLKFRKI